MQKTKISIIKNRILTKWLKEIKIRYNLLINKMLFNMRDNFKIHRI